MKNSAILKIHNVAVFGVGLIGGSLAKSLKKSGAASHIIGVGRAIVNLQKAQDTGAIDEIQTDPVQAARDADLIVLATPVNTIADLIGVIAPALSEEKVITDVGSVKYGIVQKGKQELGDHFSQFVPGHPIAGKEKSGIDAASGELFENHKVILTPLPETNPDALDLVQKMWESTGAYVKLMRVEDHDRVLSVTSHLPHILAYVMMDFLSTSPDRRSCYEMTAGGFYDFTRLASSDPEMWRDISLMNSDCLTKHICEYQEKLEEVACMIRNMDEKGIKDLFTSARQARDLVSEKRKQA